MERDHFKSIAVSLVDSSATVPSPFPRSPLVGPFTPVSTKPLPFSISKILGLEETTETSKHSPIPPVVVETQNAYRLGYQTSCSCGSCSGFSTSSSESDPDQEPIHFDQRHPKRYRATFSPTEFSELQNAFKRQPYLLSKEEDELVRRLRIQPKHLRFYFQNRRVKQRQELDRNSHAVYQTNPPDHRRYSRIPTGALQSTASQIYDKRAYFTKLFHRLENQTHLLHKPVSAKNPRSCRSPIQSSQFRRSPHTYLPTPHPDLSRIRRAMKPVRLPSGGSYHRYQPY